MKPVKLVTALILMLVMAGTAFSQPAQTQGMCPCVASMKPVKLTGKIESVTFPMAVLKTSKGETYTLRLGPWWFWQDRGYKLNAGENVDLEGFLSENANIVVPSVIRASGKEIKLRDEYGYPLWGGCPRGKRMW